MKIKSIILTTKGMYAVSNDIDTIFNKMNESYFFADTLISKDEESDLPRFRITIEKVCSTVIKKCMVTMIIEYEELSE